MAQGEFTKEEAKQTEDAVTEMFNAIPKSKRLEYIGHLNDVCLFISAAAKRAPTEEEAKAQAEVDRDANSKYDRG